MREKSLLNSLTQRTYTTQLCASMFLSLLTTWLLEEVKTSSASKESNGITWSLMRPKPLRIVQVDVGKLCWTSTQETDCFFQELQFRILWLSYGPYCISACQSSLIAMNNSKSGFPRILRNIQWTKESWTSISLKDFISSSSPSCWGGLRKM